MAIYALLMKINLYATFLLRCIVIAQPSVTITGETVAPSFFRWKATAQDHKTTTRRWPIPPRKRRARADDRRRKRISSQIQHTCNACVPTLTSQPYPPARNFDPILPANRSVCRSPSRPLQTSSLVVASFRMLRRWASCIRGVGSAGNP